MNKPMKIVLVALAALVFAVAAIYVTSPSLSCKLTPGLRSTQECMRIEYLNG